VSLLFEQALKAKSFISWKVGFQILRALRAKSFDLSKLRCCCIEQIALLDQGLDHAREDAEGFGEMLQQICMLCGGNVSLPFPSDGTEERDSLSQWLVCLHGPSATKTGLTVDCAWSSPPWSSASSSESVIFRLSW
jgi:hypothetical protein